MDEFIKIIENAVSSKDEKLIITADTELVSGLGMTSLDMMVVVCELEHKYNKKIAIDKLVKAKTIADLYSLVKE